MRLTLLFLIIFFASVCIHGYAADSNDSFTTEDLIAENDLVLQNNPQDQTALMYRALIYYNGEKYPEAISSAENVLNFYPDNSFAWHIIGTSWGKLRDFNKASDAFLKAAAISPDDPAKYNLQGVALSRLKKNDEAIVILNKALTLKPDYAVAWNNLGVVYLTMELPDKAIDAFNNAINKDPDTAVFYSNKGYALITKKDYSAAINCAMASKKIEMTNVPQWFVAADAYFLQQDYRNAFFSYDGGFTTMEKNNLWYYQGVKNTRITQDMEPVDAYYESVSANVRFSGEWDRVRVIEYKLKRYQNTLDVYDQIIVINPDFTQGWERKGYCALKLERYESAAASYKKALEANPEDPDLLASFGFATGKLGDYRTGMDYIKKAISIDPKYGRAYIFKGEIHSMYGEREEAVDALNRALEYEPGNSDAFNSLSAINLKNGDYIGSAINYFRAIIGF